MMIEHIVLNTHRCHACGGQMIFTDALDDAQGIFITCLTCRVCDAPSVTKKQPCYMCGFLDEPVHMLVTNDDHLLCRECYDDDDDK